MSVSSMTQGASIVRRACSLPAAQKRKGSVVPSKSSSAAEIGHSPASPARSKNEAPALSVTIWIGPFRCRHWRAESIIVSSS